MVNENIYDDILINGSVDSTVCKIKKPVEKTLALEGNVDILSVGTGINDAKISVGGVEINEYINGEYDVVTQLTSVTTGVTINKRRGKITTFNTTVSADTRVTFTVTNSEVASADIVHLSTQYGGDGTTDAIIGTISNGSFTIHLQNDGNLQLSTSVVISFHIHKTNL